MSMTLGRRAGSPLTLRITNSQRCIEHTRILDGPAYGDSLREPVDELLLVVFNVLRELGGYFCVRHSGLVWQKGFGICVKS